MFTRTLVAFLLLSVGVSVPAAAQSSVQPKEDLAKLVPAESMFYVERAGHEAVRDVFKESNLGQMALDPDMNRFIHDTRVAIGEQIVKSMFDLSNAGDIKEHQQTLHKLLKPFWYKPAAMFILPTPHGSTHTVRGPLGPMGNAGFICAIPKADRKEPQDALQTLMQVGVGKEQSTRQAFKWTSGKLTWDGVAYSSTEFAALPAEAKKLEEALQDKVLFMTCWTEKYLLVALSLQAVDALEKGLAQPKGLAADATFQTVMKKTEMKDWAFRWHLSPAAIGKMMSDDDRRNIKAQLAVFGLAKIEGIGGCGGYEKKTFMRRTYILSPNTETGLLRFFMPAGNFKPALAMMPQNCTMVLAGQMNPKAVAKMIRQVAIAQNGGGGEATTTTSQPGDVQLPESEEKVMKLIEDIAAGSTGDIGIYMGKIDAMGMMAGYPPAGVVLGMKNKEAAQAAVDMLLNAVGSKQQPEGDDDDAPEAERAPKEYREVTIYQLAPQVLIAAMDDRILLGVSPRGLRLAIDAAKDPDTKAGFAKDSKGATLLPLAGEGAGVFYFDLGALAKGFWPALLQVAENEQFAEHIPLRSMPETEVLTKYLGPEIAVFQNDKDGLLLKSPGLVPLVTKMVPMWGSAGMGFGMLMYMGR